MPSEQTFGLTFFGGLNGKESPCNAGGPGFDPWVGKIPLEKRTATNSSILAWRIPWTEESGRLPSIGSQSWTRSSDFHFWKLIPVIYKTPHAATAAAKLLQLCLTLCDPIDGSPPGSPVPGILQARTLEWVAIFFSNAWKWKVKVKSLSRVRPSATPRTAAFQAPPSMGFSRQEYWSGVPLPSP